MNNKDGVGGMKQELEKIFQVGWREAATLEEGTESKFTEMLLAWIDRYHDKAVAALSEALEGDQLDTDVASDVLVTLGDSEDTASHRERLKLLTSYLEAPIPRIRYGAMNGLAHLNDPAAIAAIEEALLKEKVPILKGMLKQILEYL